MGGGRTLIGYGQASPGADTGSGPAGEQVALVRGLPAVAAVALSMRCSHAHVLPVLDLGTAPNGDVVAAVPVTCGSLQALLAGRVLSAAEAVTVLAPIADAVSALHRAGLALGGFGAEVIRFDERGAPLLSAGSLPVYAAADGPAALVDARNADDEALAVLVGTLFAGHPIADRVYRERPDAAALAEWVLRAAEPAAVVFGADIARDAPPGRVPIARDPDDAITRAERPTGRRTRLLSMPGTLRRVRKRTWALTGGVGVLLLAAVVALPARAGASPAVTPAPVTVVGGASPTVASSALPGAVTDPVAAVRALLDARAGCLADGRADCLSAVDEPGSPADAQDRAAVAAGTVPAEPTGTPKIVARTGTAVTAEVGSSVVLIVEGHDAWRVRDVVPSGG